MERALPRGPRVGPCAAAAAATFHRAIAAEIAEAEYELAEKTATLERRLTEREEAMRLEMRLDADGRSDGSESGCGYLECDLTTSTWTRCASSSLNTRLASRSPAELITEAMTGRRSTAFDVFKTRQVLQKAGSADAAVAWIMERALPRGPRVGPCAAAAAATFHRAIAAEFAEKADAAERLAMAREREKADAAERVAAARLRAEDETEWVSDESDAVERELAGDEWSDESDAE